MLTGKQRWLLISIVLPVIAFSAPHAPTRSADAEAGNATVEITSGVVAQDAIAVEEAVRFAEHLFADVLDFSPERALTVTVDPGEYAPGAETYGVYDSDQIEVFTGSAPWLTGTGLQRIKGVLHEYAHFYLDPVPHVKARPVWLEEGLSEYLSWYLLSQAGLVDNAELLSYYAGHIRYWPTGQELCQLTPGSISGKSYPLAHLGVATLVEATSIQSVKIYRDSMVAGILHDEAFLAAFGLSEEQFCATANDAIWSLTPASSLPDNLYTGPAIEENGDVVRLDTPVSIRAGEQILVQAKTAELVECEMSFEIAGVDTSSLSRSATADGAGDVFWLVTIPANLPSGSVVVSAECGREPVRSVVWIGS